MKKIVSPKIVSLTFGVLVVSFLAAFYVVAWTEPATTPPGGTVATPLNTSITGQIKAGNLTINALGISGTGANIFQMPYGATAGFVLTTDGSGVASWQPSGSAGPSGGCISTFCSYTHGGSGSDCTPPSCPANFPNDQGVSSAIQTGQGQICWNAGTDCIYTALKARFCCKGNVGGDSPVPSGMIAMFDANCPVGWTRFAALDNKFPMGSSVYGGTGGGTSHTHTVDPPSAVSSVSAISSLVTYTALGGTPVPYPNWPYTGEHSHNFDITSFNSGSGSSLPPYLNVVWCKKN